MDRLFFSEALLTKLRGVRTHALSALEAPAGYGKTTAIRQLFREGDATVCWFTAVEGMADNSFRWFIRQVGTIDEMAARRLEDLGYLNRSNAEQAARILSELKPAGPLTLVFDNFQFALQSWQPQVLDALAGKFSLIVTKSISRWARNTVDSLTTIRKLKEHGCEVFFEKENIWTMDSKGELLITIMSSLAQEESRSISENTTWGIRQSFSEGKFSLPYGNFLGYCKGPNGTPEIVPDEAEIVRGIYKSFLDGETPGSIARLLTARGVPSPGGKGKWHQTTVRSILQNEKYYGSALLQKTFTTDFLTHRKKKNDGELPQYHIENSHPAIVTKEQWDLVQVELERRSRMPGRFSPKGPLGSRLVCADCGGFFGAKTWHSSDPYKTVIWRCNDKYRPGIERKSSGEKCCTGHVTEEKVMAAFSNIVADLIARKLQVVEACEAILHELLDSSATDEKRKRLEQEGDAIAKEIESLVERQARQTVEGFAEKYQEFEKRYRRIEEKLKAVTTDRQDRAYRAKQAELFLETLKRLPKQAKLENTELFMSLVDKVIVGDGLTFIMRDGTERAVNGVRF